MPTCAQCGDELAVGSRFCSSCGSRIIDASAPEHTTVDAVTSAASAQADAAEAASTAVVEPNLVHAAIETDSAEMPREADEAGPSSKAASPTSETHLYPAVPTAPRKPFTPEGFSQGAEQARNTVAAGVTAGVERIPLPSHQITRALRDGALLSGLTWAVGTLVVMVGYLLAEMPAGGPLLWIRSGVAVAAASVRAEWRLAGKAFGSEAGLAITALPTIFTMALAFAAYLFARAAQKASPTQSLRDRIWRAALTGASFGTVLVVLTVVLQGRITPDDSLTISANPIQALLGGIVVIGLPAFIGLGHGAIDRTRISAAWVADLRTVADFVIGSMILVAVFLIARTLLALISNDDILSAVGQPVSLDSGRALADGGLGVFLLIVVVPNLFATLLAQLGGMLLGGSFIVAIAPIVQTNDPDSLLGIFGANESVRAVDPQVARFGLMEGNLPPAVSVGVLLGCAVLVLAVGVRSGLRAPSVDAGGHETRMRWWQPMLIGAITYGAMLWLTTARVEGDLRTLDLEIGSLRGGAISAGVNVWGAAFAAALLTLAAVVLGRQLTSRLGAVAPAAIAFLGGRRIDPSWQVLLTDAMLRRAQQPPTKFASVAEGLRSGRIPQPSRPLV